MVESGKEFLILESYNNISWLIWIQMFIFFLLLLILCINGDNSFLSSDSVASTSDSCTSKRFIFENSPSRISHHGLGFSVNSSFAQSNQSETESSQSIKGEITPSITRTEEVENSLEKDSSQNLHHPCNLFRLAFLKCFGLDRSNEQTEDSLRQESKKER